MNRIEDEFGARLAALLAQHGLVSEPHTPSANRIPEPGALRTATDTAIHIPVAVDPVFDDHLLEETEETGDVKITRSANASYRAKRTWVQGILASVLINVGGVLTALRLDAEIDWKMLAVSVGQAALTGVIAYLHNDKTADVG